MLYDVFALDKLDTKPYVSIFWAELNQGVLEVPAWESDEVKKP